MHTHTRAAMFPNYQKRWLTPSLTFSTANGEMDLGGIFPHLLVTLSDVTEKQEEDGKMMLCKCNSNV